MTFEEYLKTKKIDAGPFRKAEAVQYEEFRQIFNQVHPDSFTHQKLFLINAIRRRFGLKEESAAGINKTQVKPKIKPRIKQ